ncbi:MAG: DUF1553 domain-containing protein, partial [Verrucomicrobiae bacterium]|nr:DUF1553 domain-containing protein [Verrucomicrobiae bacterium]
TPLQALNLLNSGFVMQQADLLAKRLTGEAAAGIGPSITRAYHLCFGRAPTDEELQDAAQFINDAGLLQFCRAMLNANESVFIP